MKRVIPRRITRALVPRARTARLVTALVLAAASATACDVHGINDPGTLSTLTISPDPKSLAVNGTQQFTAVGVDASGATVAVSPTWSVVAGGGTISNSGMFTAGTTPQTFTRTVKATSGGISSTATVVVTAGPLATVTVSPNPASLTVGATQQFTAVGKDAGGNVIAISPT